MKQPYVEDAAAQSEVLRKGQVETLIGSKEIGVTLRRMRLKRSMGLVELGEQCGLSASYLSQLETGRVVPTVRNLMRVAMVFKVDLSAFFSASNLSRFHVSKNSDRVRLPSGAKGTPFMYSESMSGLIADQKIVPCIAELLPGKANQEFEARLYQGQEFVVVLDGVVGVSTKERSEVLERHDILWVDAEAKRAYRCAGKTAARVMIISFPS